MKSFFQILTAVFAVFAFFVSCGENEPTPKPEKKAAAEPEVEVTVQEQNSAEIKEPVPEPEKPVVESKPEPKKTTKPATKASAKASGTDQNSIKKEEKTDPAKPEGQAVEPMTEEDRAKFVDKKKKAMDEEGKRLHEELKDREDKDKVENPSGQPSTLTDKDRDRVNKAEDDYRERMKQYFNDQKKDAPAENKEEKKTE